MTGAVAWTLLIVAGVLDVAWVIAVKQADGYTRVGWTLLSLGLLASFIILLGKAMQLLPVGTAYAVWTGIGATGSAVAGILLFGESSHVMRLVGIAVVVAGIALLKLAPS